MSLPETSKLHQGRMSQTFARLFNQCPHAGFLYETHGGGRSAQMDRGTALHWIIQRCIEHGEPRVPWEVAKAHIAEAERLFHVPFEERDFLSMMVYRWAEEFEVPDGWRVAACERLFEIDAGFVVRCKVDLALVSEDGKCLRVPDWKSSRAMMSQKEIGEKRTDGGLAAKAFQLILYALALKYGVPIDILECPDCRGRGERPRHTGEMADCTTCRGHGEVEARADGPLCPHVTHADVAFVFPAIEDKFTGGLGRREASVTALEFDEYLDALRGLVGRVEAAVAADEGDPAVVWPARPGSVCSECPAPMCCPIPPQLRAYRDVNGVLALAGTILTPAQASARAALVDRAKTVVKALEQELKVWSKQNDGVAVGFGDQEFYWQIVPNEGRATSRWSKRKRDAA